MTSFFVDTGWYHSTSFGQPHTPRVRLMLHSEQWRFQSILFSPSVLHCESPRAPCSNDFDLLRLSVAPSEENLITGQSPMISASFVEGSHMVPNETPDVISKSYRYAESTEVKVEPSSWNRARHGKNTCDDDQSTITHGIQVINTWRCVVWKRAVFNFENIYSPRRANQMSLSFSLSFICMAMPFLWSLALQCNGRVLVELDLIHPFDRITRTYSAEGIGNFAQGLTSCTKSTKRVRRPTEL